MTNTLVYFYTYILVITKRFRLANHVGDEDIWDTDQFEMSYISNIFIHTIFSYSKCNAFSKG